MENEKSFMTSPEQRDIQQDKEPAKPVVGDFVQWTSQGTRQWEQPKQVKGFSDDGEYAFIEGSKTGIPVSQLSADAGDAGQEKSKEVVYVGKNIEDLKAITRRQTRDAVEEKTREYLRDRMGRRRIVTSKEGAVGIGWEGEEEKKRKQEVFETNSTFKEATNTLKRKGFEVDQAGLDILEGGRFIMGGRFKVDDTTTELLVDIGVSVEQMQDGRSRFVFAPEDAYSQKEISRKMLEIADLLPYPENKVQSVKAEAGQEKSTHGIQKVIRQEGVPTAAKEKDVEALQKVMDSLGIESNRTDFFSKFVSKPAEILKNLSDEVRLKNTDGSFYSLKQGVMIVFETIATLYPDAESRAERLRQLSDRFDELKRSAENEKPGKENTAYNAFASKRILTEMTADERTLFGQKVGTLVKKPQKGSVSLSNTIDPAFVIGDFFRGLNQLKG